MKYGMRKPSWNIYDAETNDMDTKNPQQPMHGELTETIVAGAA